MAIGIDPKNDYAFKFVFGSEQRTEILVHLLNAVLGLPPGRRIESVIIRNPISEIAKLDDKLTILDIKASDESGRQFNVEMQMTVPPSLPSRILYYWSKLYSGQLTSGEEYDQLQPVISICFLDGVLFPEVEQCHLHFQLQERNSHLLFTDQMDFHLFQLPEFKKSAGELKDPLEKWLYFLNNAMNLDPGKLPVSLQEPEINKAVEALNMLTHEELERERYEAREKAKRDLLSWQRARERAANELERQRLELDKKRQDVEKDRQDVEQDRQVVEKERQDVEKGRQDVEKNRQDVERERQEVELERQELEQAKQELERARQELERAKRKGE